MNDPPLPPTTTGGLHQAVLALAAADGLLAVVTGAFGAHAVTDPGVRDLLRTGAQYQLAHAVAAVAVLAAAPRLRMATTAAWLFGGGGLVFAGSLDALALTHARWLGAITPLGGLAMIAGWALVLAASLRRRSSPPLFREATRGRWRGRRP